MKIIACLHLLTILAAVSFAEGLHSANEEQQQRQQQQQQQQIEISSKCAAVLVATTTTVGVSAAYLLTPAALCAAGFCPAGIAGGSFASWWQSTMPFVASGSLFAQLQAIAMGGSGIGSIVVASGAVGGMVGATFLQDVCTFVDETDPDSAMGISIGACEMAVNKAIIYKMSMEEKCASSEMCTASVETVAAAKKRVIDSAIATTEQLSAQCDSSEACTKARTATKDFGNAAKVYASRLWKLFTDELKEDLPVPVEDS